MGKLYKLLMQQVDLKSPLNFKAFFYKILYLTAQIQFLVINSDICVWSAYVSYIIQPFRAQIDFNPPITDVCINYLKL